MRETVGKNVFYEGSSLLAKSLTMQKTLYVFYPKGPLTFEGILVHLDKYGQEWIVMEQKEQPTTRRLEGLGFDNYEECLKPAIHVPTSSLAVKMVESKASLTASHLAPQPPIQHQILPILTTTLSQHKEISTDASKTPKRLSPQA